MYCMSSSLGRVSVRIGRMLICCASSSQGKAFVCVVDRRHLIRSLSVCYIVRVRYSICLYFTSSPLGRVSVCIAASSNRMNNTYQIRNTKLEKNNPRKGWSWLGKYIRWTIPAHQSKERKHWPWDGETKKFRRRNWGSNPGLWYCAPAL